MHAAVVGKAAGLLNPSPPGQIHTNSAKSQTFNSCPQNVQTKIYVTSRQKSFSFTIACTCFRFLQAYSGGVTRLCGQWGVLKDIAHSFHVSMYQFCFHSRCVVSRFSAGS